jgi:hypothetical protein
VAETATRPFGGAWSAPQALTVDGQVPQQLDFAESPSGAVALAVCVHHGHGISDDTVEAFTRGSSAGAFGAPTTFGPSESLCEGGGGRQTGIDSAGDAIVGLDQDLVQPALFATTAAGVFGPPFLPAGTWDTLLIRIGVTREDELGNAMYVDLGRGHARDRSLGAWVRPGPFAKWPRKKAVLAKAGVTLAADTLIAASPRAGGGFVVAWNQSPTGRWSNQDVVVSDYLP